MSNHKFCPTKLYVFLCEKIRFLNQWKEKVGKWEKGCGCKTDFYKKSIEPKQQLCCLFLFFKHKIIFIQSAKKVFISNWTFGSFVISFGIFMASTVPASSNPFTIVSHFPCIFLCRLAIQPVWRGYKFDCLDDILVFAGSLSFTL